MKSQNNAKIATWPPKPWVSHVSSREKLREVIGMCVLQITVQQKASTRTVHQGPSYS